MRDTTSRQAAKEKEILSQYAASAMKLCMAGSGTALKATDTKMMSDGDTPGLKKRLFLRRSNTAEDVRQSLRLSPREDFFRIKEEMELKKRKSSSYKKTLESILNQLENKGIETAALLEMASDYMALWESAQELKADLENRGTIVPYTTAAGIESPKPNPSLKELRDTNKQMLAIAKHLELEPSKIAMDTDDEM